MRKSVIALALLAAGCSNGQTTAELKSTTTTIPNTTVGEQLPPPQVDPNGNGQPQMCIRIGTAAQDPTIHNLIWDGENIRYEHPNWWWDSQVIGYSEYEDEGFDACGDRDKIQKAEKYQSDAVLAGATPFAE